MFNMWSLYLPIKLTFLRRSNSWYVACLYYFLFKWVLFDQQVILAMFQILLGHRNYLLKSMLFILPFWIISTMYVWCCLCLWTGGLLGMLNSFRFFRLKLGVRISWYGGQIFGVVGLVNGFRSSLSYLSECQLRIWFLKLFLKSWVVFDFWCFCFCLDVSFDSFAGSVDCLFTFLNFFISFSCPSDTIFLVLLEKKKKNHKEKWERERERSFSWRHGWLLSFLASLFLFLSTDCLWLFFEVSISYFNLISSLEDQYTFKY